MRFAREQRRWKSSRFKNHGQTPKEQADLPPAGFPHGEPQVTHLRET